MHEYTIRESSRAKYFRLKVTLEGDLVVVVPRGASLARVPALVRREAAWIERAMEAMARRRGNCISGSELFLPRIVDLRAIGESWAVQYANGGTRTAARERAGGGTRTAAREHAGGILAVTGAASRSARAAALRRWVGRKARYSLVPWLEQLSAETGLDYGRPAIRAQRTRWASCSPRGIISINQKLLFLPPHLVRYVLVHELCHTVQLNHSRRFWGLVESCQPGCRQLDRELREAWRYVPWWMCEAGSGELNESHIPRPLSTSGTPLPSAAPPSGPAFR